MKIGFIGIGVMGQSMARNLMKAGHTLTCHTRTRASAESILCEGAHWAASPGLAAREQDAVITMVGFPRDVEEVYFGSDGILAQANPGTLIIDMTTTDPDLSQQIAVLAREKGLRPLDAPVSGGDSGAKAGTLSVMVGGEKEDFQAALPLFQAMGREIVLQGASGCGQHAKMCNQIALAGALAGVCEALTYAQSHGLDCQTLLSSIGAGAAGSWQMNHMAPKMLDNDYAPGFYIKHMVKDLSIAHSQAKTAGLDLPVVRQVLAEMAQLQERGQGENGTQGLFNWYQKD